MPSTKRTIAARRKERVSQTTRSGIGISVSRVNRLMRDQATGTRLSKLAPVAAAAALDYMVTSILKDIHKTIHASGKNHRVNDEMIKETSKMLMASRAR